MKRLLILLFIFLLCSCSQIGEEKADLNKRYASIIETIKEHENFSDKSNYFDISCEMAKIDDAYRYYITIDKPSIAIYDIEAIAIEDDVDYMNQMAANIGIFESNEYSMIPNQKNPDKGFYEGVIMSGTSAKPETKLYLFIQFKNEDYSLIHTEYIVLDAIYEG